MNAMASDWRLWASRLLLFSFTHDRPELDARTTLAPTAVRALCLLLSTYADLAWILVHYELLPNNARVSCIVVAIVRHTN